MATKTQLTKSDLLALIQALESKVLTMRLGGMEASNNEVLSLYKTIGIYADMLQQVQNDHRYNCKTKKQVLLGVEDLPKVVEVEED